MSNKVLVLLAGSGAKDGSEIREAVLTLLLSKSWFKLSMCSA